ncbi:MAG: hypothetical protein ACYCSS_07380 [Sulfuriferula sp.]
MKRPDTSLKSAGRWLAGLSSHFTLDLLLDALFILWCEFGLFLLLSVLFGGHHHGR